MALRDTQVPKKPALLATQNVHGLRIDWDALDFDLTPTEGSHLGDPHPARTNGEPEKLRLN